MVRTADKNNAADVTLPRADVEKIWFADLSASSRKTLLGAGIGAAVGAGIGLIALKGSSGSGGGYGAAVPVYAVVGAVAGGLAGFFIKDKNKKEQLIYRK
jgi:outer membrane lipoprotein SlyB